MERFTDSVKCECFDEGLLKNKDGEYNLIPNRGMSDAEYISEFLTTKDIYIDGHSVGTCEIMIFNPGHYDINFFQCIYYYLIKRFGVKNNENIISCRIEVSYGIPQNMYFVFIPLIPTKGKLQQKEYKYELNAEAIIPDNERSIICDKVINYIYKCSGLKMEMHDIYIFYYEIMAAQRNIYETN